MNAFIRHYDIPIALSKCDSADDIYTAISECQKWDEAIEGLTEEIFNILFADVSFLADFNRFLAGYIGGRGSENGEVTTTNGTLLRVDIPAWVKKAVFFRDKGECRQCKRSLAKLVNQVETERYDHAVPLAAFGANDVTNIQLLCEPCNSAKSSKALPVSTLYQHALQPPPKKKQAGGTARKDRPKGLAEVVTLAEWPVRENFDDV